MIDLSKLSQNMWQSSANYGSQKRPTDSWNTNMTGKQTGVTPIGGTGGNLASPTSYQGSDDWSSWAAPDWMGGGAYAKWTTQDPDYDPNDPVVNQAWWRSPSLNPEGGLVWNDTYGWQDRSAVKNLYKNAGGPVTDDVFSQWGLTPQLDQNWQQYYPQGAPGATTGGGGTGGGTSLLDFGDPNDPGRHGGWWDPNRDPGSGQPIIDGHDPNTAQDPLGWVGSGQTGNTDGSGYQTPWQWDQAGNTLGEFAQTGGYVGAPAEWAAASGGAANMAQGGMPTDVDPWYQQAKAVSDYDTQEAIKNAAEQAGLSGNRWSTSLGRTAQDIGGKYASQLGAQYAQQSMAAQEAARARQQEANNQLFNFGSGYAGLDTAARQRQLDATNQLTGLGGAETGYKTGLANQMAQIGSGLTSLDQNALTNAYQNFMRMADENNPWLAQAMGMATGQGQQQQYTQGLGSQLMGGLSSILPFLFL